MSDVAPVDAGVRALVRDDHDASLFIEAGAGTGKTTALVERVVALVASGAVELRELAAITFTEAAASELRDRIRARLEQAAAGDVEWIADDRARSRCHAALAELDDAALTTLHGFAQRLLSEHPLEAGLPPVFEVLDEIRARVRFEQRWGELVDRLFDDPALEETLLVGLVLGVEFQHLRAAARIMDDNHDRVGPPAPVRPLPALDIAPLLASLDDIVSTRHAACDEVDDLLACHIDEFVGPYRASLGRRSDRIGILELLADPRKLGFKQGQGRNWSVPIAEVRAGCGRAEDLRHQILETQRQVVLANLAHHVVTFVRDDAEERRREGTLEFHDLLVFARNLLRDNDEIRAAAAQRWKRVLLDEFQDTDPLQIQLAVLLATTEAGAGARDWRDVRVEPGALAVVGDPKQSIYRFRRADLRVYDDARTRLGLTEVALVENFRSVPGIIAFVNILFSDVLTDDAPGVQAHHVELHPHRAALDGRRPVSIVGGAAEERVGLIREREAEEIAAVVQQVKRERWPVGRGDGSVDAARFEDVAILIPSRTVLPGIEDALERAGIPVRVESQSLLFATAEIRDLVSVLTAIDDPSDAIAIVAALRSAAFGCSDTELTDYVSAKGRWDYRNTTVPDGFDDDHPVVAGLRALRAFWSERWWRSVSETVEAVVRERRFLELAVARRRPRDHWRRIRYFLDQARAWDDAGQATLRGFIEWAKEQAEERARVAESVAPEPDDDAVRILTIHGSKGLEFPVVVLAGLSTQPPNFSPAVVWGADGQPELRVGRAARRAETPGYDAAITMERRHDEAERLRLLYVAMTRARDHLVVSMHHKQSSRCHAASIAAPVAASDAQTLEPGEPLVADAFAPSEVALTPEPATYLAWARARSDALAQASRPLTVAATTLATLDEADVLDPGLAKDMPGEQVPTWRRGRAGTAIGRAVHAVLQTVDLVRGAGLAETARAQAFAEGVADRADEVHALAEAAMAAPVVRDAVDGGHRWWREVPVAAEIDGIVLEGFIDLLVEHDDGLVVVDYKTDQMPDAALDAAVSRYAVQGAAYAVALEATLGRPVVRCTFVFARTTGALERDVVDLDAAQADVRSRIATLRD
jgi:ATP-dependent exoDNAse (exonuclease V) beta subunit